MKLIIDISEEDYQFVKTCGNPRIHGFPAIMNGIPLDEYKAENRPKGKWNVLSDGYCFDAYIGECSECKDTVWVYKDTERAWNYCPNCGADMRE